MAFFVPKIRKEPSMNLTENEKRLAYQIESTDQIGLSMSLPY